MLCFMITKLIYHFVFEGREFNKLRILDHGYGDVGLIQWIREKVDVGTARNNSEATLKKIDSNEAGLTMLQMNLRGFISHIAEVTVLLRIMYNKHLFVAFNETYMTKTI